MNSRSIGILLLLASSTGCLTGETTSTMYIEHDGGVSWTVLESDVRSTSKDPAKREREERGFIRAVKRGEHDAQQGFEILQPDAIETVIVRDERPYAVATTARFGSPDALARRLLDWLEIPGAAYLESTPEMTRLLIELDVPAEEGEQGAPDETSDLSIVLVRGRFVETTGFRVLAEDRVTFADPDELERLAREAGGRLVLRLAWTLEE